jgi:hypothetical protein
MIRFFIFAGGALAFFLGRLAGFYADWLWLKVTHGADLAFDLLHDAGEFFHWLVGDLAVNLGRSLEEAEPHGWYR